MREHRHVVATFCIMMFHSCDEKRFSWHIYYAKLLPVTSILLLETGIIVLYATISVSFLVCKSDIARNVQDV